MVRLDERSCYLVVRRKRELKVVITSATLDGEKFSAYFNDCPVLSVPGRVFDVQIVHSRDNHESDIMQASCAIGMFAL